MIAVAAGVWFAGLGSAAALTYDLNRPLHSDSARATSQVASQLAAPPAPILAPAVVAPPDSLVLRIPTVTIRGSAQRHQAAAPAPKAREPTSMQCAGWRELDMGSGRVQVCQ